MEERQIAGWRFEPGLPQAGFELGLARAVLGQNLAVDFDAERESDEIAHEEVHPPVGTAQVGKHGPIAIQQTERLELLNTSR